MGKPFTTSFLEHAGMLDATDATQAHAPLVSETFVRTLTAVCVCLAMR